MIYVENIKQYHGRIITIKKWLITRKPFLMEKKMLISKGWFYFASSSRSFFFNEIQPGLLKLGFPSSRFTTWTSVKILPKIFAIQVFETHKNSVSFATFITQDMRGFLKWESPHLKFYFLVPLQVFQ